MSGLLPPSEDYADCWRGAVDCVTDPPASWGDGRTPAGAGDFRLFGAVELMARVGPAAQSIQVGPHRGVGGPVQPPP